MRAAIASIASVMILTFSVAVRADVPQVISYQGKVTDTGGIPVADGTYSMQFAIYDAVTGGTALWNSGTVTIQVTGGVFSVLLGQSPQPTLDLYFNQDYWLEAIVESDLQSPRQQLGSVGYAYMASGLVPGTEVSGWVSSGSEAAISGTNTASGLTYGIVGKSFSTLGVGVFGYVTATTGMNYGVYGQSVSPIGAGVYGLASASSGTPYGVYGSTYSPSGIGVYGVSYSTTGGATGVHGSSASPLGFGVYGRSFSDSGVGIFGMHQSTAGTAAGVLGQTNSTSNDATGVTGRVESTAPGSYSAAVRGINNGTESLGIGVYGSQAGSGWGVYGITPGGRGVYGLSENTVGTNYGVYGQTNSPGGYGVYYVGGIGGSGLMHSIVQTSQGPTGLDVVTAAGNWVEDFGEGHLVAGRSRIVLDPLFLETVTIDEEHPMKVFVQLRGECNGVFVEKRTAGFDVVELQGGSSSVPFDYRVIAQKKGFEDRRLEIVGAARNDSYIYPELRE